LSAVQARPDSRRLEQFIHLKQVTEMSGRAFDAMMEINRREAQALTFVATSGKNRNGMAVK